MNHITKNYYFTANDICDVLGIKMPNLYYHLGRTPHQRYKFVFIYRPRNKKHRVYFYDFITVYEIANHVYNEKARKFKEQMFEQYKLATKIAYGKYGRPPIAYDSEEDFKYQLLDQIYKED